MEFWQIAHFVKRTQIKSVLASLVYLLRVNYNFTWKGDVLTLFARKKQSRPVVGLLNEHLAQRFLQKLEKVL